jgi:hypothetical protein
MVACGWTTRKDAGFTRVCIWGTVALQAHRRNDRERLAVSMPRRAVHSRRNPVVATLSHSNACCVIYGLLHCLRTQSTCLRMPPCVETNFLQHACKSINIATLQCCQAGCFATAALALIRFSRRHIAQHGALISTILRT